DLQIASFLSPSYRKLAWLSQEDKSIFVLKFEKTYEKFLNSSKIPISTKRNENTSNKQRDTNFDDPFKEKIQSEEVKNEIDSYLLTELFQEDINGDPLLFGKKKEKFVSLC